MKCTPSIASRSTAMAVLAVTLAFALFAGAPSLAGIVPVDQSYAGKTYSEWSAASWKWWIEIDYDGRHPARDFTGAQALRNQRGPVYFLTPAARREPVTRRISIPEGIALFLPLAGAACSDIEADPFFGADEAAQRACAEAFQHSDLYCAIDGEVVTNLADFQNTSARYDFIAPPINTLGVPGGTRGLSVGAGIDLLIEPFAPGSHSIHFTTATPELGFFSEVTYLVTVNPRPPLTIKQLPEPNMLELSWKITPGFVLQEADRLDGPWIRPTVLSNVTANGLQVVTLSTLPTARYFRLGHP